MLRVLLGGRSRGRKCRKQVPQRCLATLSLELVADSPQHIGQRRGGQQRDHAEYFRTLKTVSFGTFERPLRNSSSTRNASACTAPPSVCTRAAVAAAVPPVASTSSMISTRCPASTASA